MNYYISGNQSGLGKYLFNNLKNAFGFGRNEITNYKTNTDTTIVHCAFNKENEISNYYKYLNDNIFLTKNLLEEHKYRKFIYISSIDIYSENQNMYSTFKKFSESLVSNYQNYLILRCPTLLGNTMKPNHIHKIKNNDKSISLSEKSTFCYINMQQICNFIEEDSLNYDGIIDFVPKDFTELKEIKKFFKSDTLFGNYIYKSNFDKYINPIFEQDKKYSTYSYDNFLDFIKEI